MSLSSEWYEYHLTPEGWVDGTVKLDFGGTQVPVPLDRVLTVQEHRLISHFAADEDVSLNETFRSTNTELVEALISKFGKEPYVSPPFKHSK